MKNILASIGFLSILLIVGFLCASVGKPKTAVVDQYITQVPIPAHVDFAGESLPLHEYDVKERLDRELTAVTHRHSSSTRIIKLAGRWFPVIEEILRRHGVPDDFKYLAVAESGLENVISPKKAKGFWQFIKSTADMYNLEVSADVDERYHIEKATVAACKYFKKAHARFGSWAMAAASYNMGIGGVNKQATNQQSFNYFDLYLNSETSKYLFRITAYKLLLSSPQSYGFHLQHHDLYHEVPHTTTTVMSIGDIASFARSHGTNYKKIKLLNPWLRSTSLRAKNGKVYTLKLPL